jgi:hypothetical protein
VSYSRATTTCGGSVSLSFAVGDTESVAQAKPSFHTTRVTKALVLNLVLLVVTSVAKQNQAIKAKPGNQPKVGCPKVLLAA